MPNKFASGKHSIAECDRCGERYKLHSLKTQTLKTKPFKIKVCRACWDPDHPQLQLGMYPVSDPQGVREPRPDVSYYSSGNNSAGYPSDGSRDTQWGWNPVGGSKSFDRYLTPNSLIPIIKIGNVTVVTT